MTNEPGFHRRSRRETHTASSTLIGYRIATKESRERLEEWVKVQKSRNVFPDDLSIPKSPKLIEVIVEGIHKKNQKAFEVGLRIGRLSVIKKELAEFLESEKGNNIDERLLSRFFAHEDEQVTLGKPELYLPSWQGKERRAARQLIALYREDEKATEDQRHIIVETTGMVQAFKEAHLKTDSSVYYPYFLLGSLDRDFSNVEQSAAINSIKTDATESFPDITFGKLKFDNRRTISSNLAS